MAKQKKPVHRVQMTEGKRNIIHQLLEEYDIQTADDIQEAVAKNWDAVTSENVKELADIDGYWDEFYNMFGFKIDGVDYSADVDIM